LRRSRLHSTRAVAKTQCMALAPSTSSLRSPDPSPDISTCFVAGVASQAFGTAMCHGSCFPCSMACHKPGAACRIRPQLFRATVAEATSPRHQSAKGLHTADIRRLDCSSDMRFLLDLSKVLGSSCFFLAAAWAAFSWDLCNPTLTCRPFFW